MNRPKKEVLDAFLFSNATKFKFETNDPKLGFVNIERRSLNNKRWVITNTGFVWSKSEDDFIYESMSSGRNDDIKDTGFESVYDALDVVMGMIKS